MKKHWANILLLGTWLSTLIGCSGCSGMPYNQSKYDQPVTEMECRLMIKAGQFPKHRESLCAMLPEFAEFK